MCECLFNAAVFKVHHHAQNNLQTQILSCFLMMLVKLSNTSFTALKYHWLCQMIAWSHFSNVHPLQSMYIEYEMHEKLFYIWQFWQSYTSAKMAVQPHSYTRFKSAIPNTHCTKYFFEAVTNFQLSVLQEKTISVFLVQNFTFKSMCYSLFLCNFCGIYHLYYFFIYIFQLKTVSTPFYTSLSIS